MKPSLLSTCRLLIFLFCILMYSVVNAQTQKVSINAKNVTLQSLFSTIEKQTNLHFSYQTDIINSSRRVTLNLQNVSVASILMQVLPGFNLRHELVSGNSIVITRQDTSRKPLQTNPKKISGIVLDEHGEPIIGATIKQQGSKSGTITDVDGRFSLDAPEGCMLTISYIGYADKAVTAQSDMSISLSTNIEALDEVVVVGYGIQKKVNVVGSISAVNSKDLEGRGVGNVSNLLTGHMAGVTITQKSGNPGQDDGTIHVRGVGSFGATPDPLVLIDGMPGTLSELIPSDIDNISILKDASSAAIYGSRAANGVILVTTKRGQEGRTRVVYNGSAGFSKAIELPEFAHSYEFAEYYNMAIGTETYTSEMIQKYKDGSDPDNYANENYLQKLLGGSAFQTKHEVSVNGGTGKLQYMASMGYLRQNGLMEGNYYNRYNARVNLSADITSKLKMHIRLSGAISDRHEPSTPGVLDMAGVTGIIQQAVRFPGLTPSYMKDGSIGQGPKLQGSPIAWINSASYFREDLDKMKANV